jgi:hypothetical protein
MGIANFSASNGWIDRFKKRHKPVYRTESGESRSVDPVEDWKNCRLLQEIEGYDSVIYNADEPNLFFNMQAIKKNLHFMRRF